VKYKHKQLYLTSRVPVPDVFVQAKKEYITCVMTTVRSDTFKSSLDDTNTI
jgi:hypothetical protein